MFSVSEKRFSEYVESSWLVSVVPCKKTRRNQIRLTFIVGATENLIRGLSQIELVSYEKFDSHCSDGCNACLSLLRDGGRFAAE